MGKGADNKHANRVMAKSFIPAASHKKERARYDEIWETLHCADIVKSRKRVDASDLSRVRLRGCLIEVGTGKIWVVEDTQALLHCEGFIVGSLRGHVSFCVKAQ